MAFDTILFRFLYSLTGQSKLIDFIVIAFAEYLPYLLLIIVAVIIFKERQVRMRLYHVMLIILGGLIGRGLITEGIRFFYRRLRPYAALGIPALISETSASFPSGHATFYGMLATAVLLINRRAGIWFFVATFFMGIARIMAGVHYPSDILGGFGIGVLTTLLARRVIGKFYRFPAPSEIPPGNASASAT